MNEVQLSNIRDFLGWLIGRKVVDVTADDPPTLPDSQGDGDGNFVVVHFDNGGTLDVPIGVDGFHYDNPVSRAADRGELCEACQAGSFSRRGDTDAGTLRRERGAEGLTQVDPRDAPDGPGLILYFDPVHGPCLVAQADRMPRGDFDCDGPINDLRIDDIILNPPAYKPANPYYQKNHVSAPGTVRQWFRTMRAADFEHACHAAWVNIGRSPSLRPWTFFDTQKVVDRETAGHYLEPVDDFIMGGRVCRIGGFDWGATPSFGLFVVSPSLRAAYERMLRGDPASPGAGRGPTER